MAQNRRRLYTTSLVRKMQFNSQNKDYNDKESLKVVRRDELIHANMKSVERVENKR